MEIMEKSFIQIKSEAIEQIQTVFDPEIPVNVYELGLIYDVNVDPMNNVHILMTLTSPSCPAAGSLPGEIEEKDIDPDDISKKIIPNEKIEGDNEKSFSNDMSGDDLDIPGSELDDEQEAVGSEDEENNHYSLGGDDKNGLDEDKA